jgi:hypothetical protein
MEQEKRKAQVLMRADVVVPTEPKRQADNAAKTGALAPAPSLKTLVEWAQKNGVEAEWSGNVLDLLPKLPVPAAMATKGDFEVWAAAKVEQTHNAVAAAKQFTAMEPVGLLHLERLNFVPAGIERGELVHSVPLSPGEEVNIAHKEWANTSEEFSKIVTDFMEAYSEEA